MRAIICKDWGDPDTLELGELPEPALGPGQVRIRMRAAGVNFADCVLVRGQYQEKPDLPFAPGLEGAGEVMEVGDGVTDFKPGDRVMAVVSAGAYAEQAVCEATTVFHIPDGMDNMTAAAFPVAYGTSHLALVHRAKLKAGETLLVLGAGGGVGLTAIECGKALGATVIAAASTAEKLELARARGADHLINYAEEDLRGTLKKITDGQGVDVVYDPVGGALAQTAMRSLAWSGRLLVIGFASGDVPEFPSNYLLVKNISIVGVYWGAYRTREPETFRDGFAELAQWWADGKLNPHVSQVLPLADVAKALAMLEGRQATGRLVIDIDG
ncbi:MAG: NADPH:quinone oxidoreductase family protein [Rhodospirillaceae bacterium]|jgi:NADPH2:quinone reductase|nr:NADPH:quinone oxidoreductase family protein [Rhodospirillaceae bacterium]MBT3929146.1 NADPH:quinone oxidoreductase family protein [Rhodospirillaceae bacterium]MBT4773095.1 NADPH:quinone oxidoreductase family protein [Rhodospirillaceae bacterium]MBT5358443.1 NADPH:quinone oxidoreductase family protein [Rhodospirillaceae bacterium]MBT5768481.1 NADPH:quinone oxidoreductase family protein [Rhodospirillaceae bacterium]